MLKVQCELIDLRKKTSDYYVKMQRDERIKFLESSIHWLRNEALKLCNSIDSLKLNNINLQRELDITVKENEFMNTYTRSTKRYNLLLQQTVNQLKDDQI